MKGITITLISRVQTGYDAFYAPTWTEVEEEVDNVLVGEPSAEDVSTSVGLYGKHVAYVLGIPKDDTHDWKDVRVRFFGQEFRTFGAPVEGIRANVPTPWHKKVKVERYE